jgi:DNA-binding CsgD family transcriptional regulator
MGADAGIAGVLDEAARKAERRGAPEAAAALLEQAAACTPETEPDRGAQRSMEAAERHFEAGATARARDLFATLTAGAPSRDLRLKAGVRLGAMRLLMGDLSGATEAFDRARGETTEPESVAPGIEDGLALVSEFRGDLPAAARHARAAIRLAELQHDRAMLVQTLARAAFFEARLGRSSAWARIRRALVLSEEVEDLKVIAHPGWIHAQLLAGRGEVAAACAVLRDLRERALERGDEGSLGVVLTSLCENEIRAGRLAEASSAAEEGYLSILGTGQISQLIFMLKGVVLVDALCGHVDKAMERAARARELIAKTEFDPLLANMDTALGMLELSRGDAEAAHRALAPLAKRVPMGTVRETGWLRFLADDIEALVALGELDSAREALAKLKGRRRTLLDQAWTAQAVLRCSGLIDVAAGNSDTGLRDLAGAVRRTARGQEPFEHARALLALGRTQRRLKRRREARETLTHAGEIFARMGMPLWQARVEDELSRLGGRPARASGLTETEQRVAQLAGEGLTNREIAAALYLSVNTVQAYLKRVYRELGVRSRTELARRFHSGQSLKEH